MLIRNPRLMFADDDGSEAGTTPPEPITGETNAEGATDQDRGFPLQTPVDQMTDSQQAAYWRGMAKAKQKEAEAAERALKPFGGLTKAEEAATEYQKLKAGSLTEEESKIAEARKAGADEASSRYVSRVLRAELSIATGRTVEEIDAALEFVDTARFVATDGDIDADRLSAFAKTLGTPTPAPRRDPIADALGHTHYAPPVNSLESAEEQAYVTYSGKKAS